MSIFDKKIKELNGLSFFVPAYQRGYRWGKDEVRALLDDIYEAKENKCDGYCIQPLILKPRADKAYEVVDGQQRLTTIYIFMKVAEQEIKSATPPFSLDYETRDNCTEFLKSLSDEEESQKKRAEEKEKYIDYYNIAEAYDAVNEWLSEQDDKSVAVQEMNSFIRKSVFFIWYELPEDSDPITVFTKVNLGKIPLTNAELIKALFLNKDNFANKKGAGNGRVDIAYKNELEIAIEWDTFEHGLNDDAFWYFLQGSESQGTRIDLLLNLLAREKDEKGEGKDRPDYAFAVLYNLVKNADDKDACVNQLWHEISQMYSDFRYWYSNEDLYHIIGYLIYAGVNLSEIREITRNKSKSQFLADLIARAKKTVQGTIFEKGNINLEDIYYKQTATKTIRNILLLFNIATLYCENRQEYRFPFKLFKSGRNKWDIEHIHATADDTADADDGLGNLTLLSDRINRSYKDDTFDNKRETILDYESKGWFIPVCTRNVFLKSYSDSAKIKDMNDWYDEDKEAYLNKMAQIFKKFFAGEKIGFDNPSDGGSNR